MGRAERITEVIKNHDPKLFCESIEGKLCIYREGSKWEHYAFDGIDLLHARPNHYFVIALTADWRMASEPCEWGLVPIVERLKAIDLWNRDLAEESIKSIEKHAESMARKRSNDTESFLIDNRRQFAKAFNDVNTSNLKKIDKRKLGEKKYVNR